MRIVRAVHPCRTWYAAESERGRRDVHVIQHYRRSARQASVIARLLAADEERNANRFLIRCGFAELAMRAVHIAMVAKQQDVSLEGQARILQRFANPADVP